MKPNPVALLIDDERATRRWLRLLLEPQRYKVQEAASGGLGLQLAAARRPDVIIMDLTLPDLDGLEVLSSLREWSQVPILVLSARNLEEEKVAALDGGANDYVTKPFGPAELLARLRVLQRCLPGVQEEPLIVEGDLQVDIAAHKVAFKGRPINLTATEEALFHVLVRFSGKMVTCKHLLRSVWGSDAPRHLSDLRVYMTQLRKKLQVVGVEREMLIRTEGSLGYRLLLPAEAEPGLLAAAVVD